MYSVLYCRASFFTQGNLQVDCEAIQLDINNAQRDETTQDVNRIPDVIFSPKKLTPACVVLEKFLHQCIFCFITRLITGIKIISNLKDGGIKRGNNNNTFGCEDCF